jgi:diguanylate cyclase (GGDEF)-like protein
VNELLDRKLYEATILSEIGKVARTLTQLDQTFTSVMALVARVADFSVGGIAFVDEDELELMLVVQRPASEAVVEEAKQKLLEAVAGHLKGASVARVHARVLQPGTPSGPEETKLQGFHSVPIMTGGRLTGMLALCGRGLQRLPPESGALLEKVANQALIVTENSRLFDRVRNLSLRDSLTDLFNHRHSMELLSIEYQRVARYEGQVGVLMMDVDLFKQVNDELGHQAGDSVLREVARRLREGLRSVDALGRYGGEEFIAILPHTSLEEARQTAERLRRAVNARPMRIAQQDRPVTISVGVATYPAAGVDSPADLVRRADAALYRAKQAGRNQVAS